MSLNLRPSEIHFSQDTIFNRFRNTQNIGNVLDNIFERRLQVDDLPRITVARHDGRWFSADNRRLWIFKKLQKLGRCSSIEVIEISEIPSNKMTTKNEGISVEIIGGDIEADNRRLCIFKKLHKLGRCRRIEVTEISEIPFNKMTTKDKGRTIEIVDDLPCIAVADHDGRWFSADNRRLWIFRKLNQLGRCRHIKVIVISAIPSNKMTTTNRGISVEIVGGDIEGVMGNR
ncbi:hypothetical protein MAR_006762 [Mya arenaria]|uniref:Uncharacterized protein n=1 Tax=Mya arenaria TaxID=6604 RepID=A0ABY7D9G2_MYAAR|nr:hypothetical protein MAR_006762 [Mya arenaria]